MAKRTLIEFSHQADIWPTIDSWATESEYRLKPAQSSDTAKLYQKGVGFLVAPMMLHVEKSSDKVKIQAWIRINLFVRIQSLFILPAEMSIESGGFRAALPRKMARTAINALLAKLGQPQIQ